MGPTGRRKGSGMGCATTHLAVSVSAALLLHSLSLLSFFLTLKFEEVRTKTSVLKLYHGLSPRSIVFGDPLFVYGPINFY